METQILSVLKRPVFAISSLFIAVAISLAFLYLDGFYFVSPYLILYIDPSRIPLLLVNVALSSLAGVVMTSSVYEIRAFPDLKGSYRKTGMAGILAAFVAGACPCYYLGALLVVFGGAGGVLGALGTLLFDYEVPIKLGSLALLAFTTYTLERGLRAACSITALRTVPAN